MKCIDCKRILIEYPGTVGQSLHCMSCNKIFNTEYMKQFYGHKGKAMKVTVQIWQNTFNSEWNCDITTSSDSQNETQHWAVDDFCALLNLLGEKFPGAKCVALHKFIENKSCEHVFEPIPESYDVRRCSYKARCVKCEFEPE